MVECNLLKNWNGDLKFLPNFKFCHFSKKHFDQTIKKQKNNVNKGKSNTLDNLENINKPADLEDSNQRIDIITDNKDKMEIT
jgi:hypothetical protein